MNSTAILNQLSSFIDVNNPKLATFLTRQWKMQQNAVTYAQLREAIFNGQLDMSYLLQWQQDYSEFVAQHYAPIAEKAIFQAASDLTQAYNGFVFDPQAATIDTFIKTQGGKLIKEISIKQFNAINTLMRQAALTETMTVDELARVIRPCIGLTQRQAQTAKNYYDNLIAQGYDPKDAQKKQARYAEMLHRRRAQTIAQTELAFAYNAGADAVVQQNIKDGYFKPGVTKKWLTADDERVCKECGAIDGEEVAIDAPFSIGVKLPPAHPLCRCAVAYNNIEVAVQPPAQATTAATGTQPDPTYQQPSIADAPKLENLQYASSKQMGTGEMHQYTDAAGQEWIFKPAQSKSGTPEAFRAYVQEAGYKVQSIVDPDSAVPCGTITLQTPKGQKFGAAQLKIQGIDPGFDLKAWQSGYGPPPSAQVITQLQRENVTDWLMCNFDSHGGNFLLEDATGRLIGVDKEQAFRYIGDAAAKKMSITYHPNAKYGETEPIYNTLYRKYAKGEIDINLNDTLAYIKRVETIPDAEYREIFRDYAEALYGKGNKAEHLLDQIVSRKQNLRATYETFYGELLTQRKGTATTFQFVDNAASAAAKPLQATIMSSQALSGMSLPDLQAIAKQQGIKYAWNMNKSQLVQAISDPTKTAQLVQDAKNRAYGIGTTPKKPKPTATAATAATGKRPKIEGITQLGDAMDDFDVVLANSGCRGVSLISDSSALEGMQTTLRKVTIDGEEFYELSGKLTHDRWISAFNGMQANSSNVQWQFNQVQGVIDYTKPVLDLSGTNIKRLSGFSTQCIKNGDDVIVLAGKDAENHGRAMMGSFNIRVKASNGKDAAQKVQALLQQANMTDITDDVTAATLDRYKKMRVIWQTDPKAAQTLGATATDAQISSTLSRLGITQKRIDAMKVKQITDGYFTIIDPENVTLAAKYKVAYLYHEAETAGAVVNVIKSGELLSTTTRYGRGIFANGASSSTDIRTGGADSVFTRIVHESDIANGKRRYGSFGDYVFVFDKKSLERTDWYAYKYDEFGSTEDYKFQKRHGTEEHFRDTSSRYSDSNELLFRKCLPLDTLKEIRVPASERTALIDRLKQEGITKINGIPVEKIIKVGGGTV